MNKASRPILLSAYIYDPNAYHPSDQATGWNLSPRIDVAHIAVIILRVRFFIALRLERSPSTE